MTKWLEVTRLSSFNNRETNVAVAIIFGTVAYGLD